MPRRLHIARDSADDRQSFHAGNVGLASGMSRALLVQVIACAAACRDGSINVSEEGRLVTGQTLGLDFVAAGGINKASLCRAQLSGSARAKHKDQKIDTSVKVRSEFFEPIDGIHTASFTIDLEKDAAQCVEISSVALGHLEPMKAVGCAEACGVSDALDGNEPLKESLVLRTYLASNGRADFVKDRRRSRRDQDATKSYDGFRETIVGVGQDTEIRQDGSNFCEARGDHGPTENFVARA